MQREFVHRAVLPSWPPKSPHAWASLGVPSPADAHDARACGAHHEVTAAGARIMSISGARRTQTSPGMRAWGAKMGGSTARCTNSRCPHLAQPVNIKAPIFAEGVLVALRVQGLGVEGFFAV